MNSKLHRSIEAINTLQSKPYYLPNVFYSPGEEIIYNGREYLCVSINKTKSTPILSSDWDEIIS